jgi:hypothetical protein
MASGVAAPARSRSRGVDPFEAALRAALAAAEAALAAERARAAAERDAADYIRRLLRDALNSMTRDIRELAAIAHRAGASNDLVNYWYDGPPPPSEPEAEPDPR